MFMIENTVSVPINNVTSTPAYAPRSCRILLVEDMAVIRQVVLAHLRRLGVEQVDCAQDGIEALRYLAQEEYDLVFMDCQLPRLDGYKTTQILRHREGDRDRQTPVIALTAERRSQEREHCLRVGMNDVFGKPLSLEQLQAILKTWIPHFIVPQTVAASLENQTCPLTPLSDWVDMAYLNNITGHDYEFIQELLVSFLKNFQVGIAQLTFLLVQEEREDLQQLAHKLKGAAAIAGICHWPDLLDHLEKNAPTASVATLERNLEEITCLWPPLQRQLQETIALLARWTMENQA